MYVVVVVKVADAFFVMLAGQETFTSFILVLSS
jgi:hypothetical protein